MAYPGTIDSYTPVQGTTLLASVDHAGQHNQVGSAVVAIENKLGIGSGSAAANQILVGSGVGTTAWGTTWNNGALGSPTITGGTINSAVLGTPTIQGLADNTTGNVGTAAHGFAPKAPNDATKYLDGTGAYSVPASASTDGWTSDSDTYVYVSASSFKVAGKDVTARFTKGTRVKFTNNSVVVYGVVISSSFSSDTTVSLLPNSDYSINNSAITLPYYSYQASPQGYPTFFNVSSTFGAGGSMTISASVVMNKMAILGNAATWLLSITGTLGGTTSNVITVTTPVNQLSGVADNYNNMGELRDGASTWAMAGKIQSQASQGNWYILKGDNSNIATGASFIFSGQTTFQI